MKRQAIIVLIFLISFFNCSNLKQISVTVGGKTATLSLVKPPQEELSEPEPETVKPRPKPAPVVPVPRPMPVPVPVPGPVPVPQCNNCKVDTEKDVHINMTPLVAPGSKYQGPKLIKLHPRHAMLHPVRRFVIVEEEVKPANCS